MFHRLLLGAALALALSPAFAGKLTDAGKLGQLKTGKTTAAQTVKLLGKPNQENRSPDGRFAYMYEFDLANKTDAGKPHLQGVAALMFSKAGVLQGMEMFKKADGAPAAKAPAKPAAKQATKPPASSPRR